MRNQTRRTLVVVATVACVTSVQTAAGADVAAPATSVPLHLARSTVDTGQNGGGQREAYGDGRIWWVDGQVHGPFVRLSSVSAAHPKERVRRQFLRMPRPAASARVKGYTAAQIRRFGVDPVDVYVGGGRVQILGVVLDGGDGDTYGSRVHGVFQATFSERTGKRLSTVSRRSRRNPLVIGGAPGVELTASRHPRGTFVDVQPHGVRGSRAVDAVTRRLITRVPTSAERIQAIGGYVWWVRGARGTHGWASATVVRISDGHRYTVTRKAIATAAGTPVAGVELPGLLDNGSLTVAVRALGRPSVRPTYVTSTGAIRNVGSVLAGGTSAAVYPGGKRVIVDVSQRRAASRSICTYTWLADPAAGTARVLDENGYLLLYGDLVGFLGHWSGDRAVAFGDGEVRVTTGFASTPLEDPLPTSCASAPPKA